MSLATYSTPCETTLRDKSTCGAPSRYRYPTKGGGFHHLCTEHAQKHLRYCEGADGYLGVALEAIRGPVALAPDEDTVVRPEAPPSRREQVLELIARRGGSAKTRMVSTDLGLTMENASAVLAQLVQRGQLERVRLGEFRLASQHASAGR